MTKMVSWAGHIDAEDGGLVVGGLAAESVWRKKGPAGWVLSFLLFIDLDIHALLIRCYLEKEILRFFFLGSKTLFN